MHGVGLAAVGKIDEALAAFARALAARPGFPEAHYNLGNTLQAQQRLPEAVASYERALESRPNFVEALCNLGNAYMATDQLEAAEGAYRKALRRSPQQPERRLPPPQPPGRGDRCGRPRRGGGAAAHRRAQ
jgi:tetratricopeptide (TPR) repeat protein